MSPVLLEHEGAVARITLNRPDAGNAIDMALASVADERAAAVRC